MSRREQPLIFPFINIDKNYIRAVTAFHSIDYTSVVSYGGKYDSPLITGIVYTDD